MDHADFVHLVRLSELASAENSTRYRRGIMAFVALGYLWVLACLAVAVGLLLWLAYSLWHGPVRGWQIWTLLLALGLLWTCLRAIWVRIEVPEGALRVQAQQAPALFEALEHIRLKIKGPPIHVVYLDDSFNASIMQVPRWGLLGGAQNILTLGLPLVMGLDRARLLAVLAHEYGHLRADHGRFAAWVYRTRQSWQRMQTDFEEDNSPEAMATRAFFRWYFPRFQARSFALARQDEYEADRVSAKLLGHEVAAAALVEIELKSSWLAEHFWRQHWRLALNAPQPVGPLAAMRRALLQPLEPQFAQQALRQALRSTSDVADTHPVLRDRLEALDQPPQLPAWSQHGALSLLGEHAAAWIAELDARWCREQAKEWRAHHQRLQRWRERVLALSQAREAANADELVEEAQLRYRLSPATQVLPLYQRALQLNPSHGAALQGIVSALPRTLAQRAPYLERLWASSPMYQWSSAQQMVELLEQPAAGEACDACDAQALQRWRQRRKEAAEAEQRAHEELMHGSFLSDVSRHDLSPFELANLQAELRGFTGVASVWLVRKNLHEYPWRRAYLLFVQWQPKLVQDDPIPWMRMLDQHLDAWDALPGPFYIVSVGASPTVQEVRRLAGNAIYPA